MELDYGSFLQELMHIVKIKRMEAGLSVELKDKPKRYSTQEEWIEAVKSGEVKPQLEKQKINVTLSDQEKKRAEEEIMEMFSPQKRLEKARLAFYGQMRK